ncbi:MAG TPA: DNA polymerase III subunit epsilon [Burkholderiales bacterium]|nr:DNA polymerase III subunit epsilon [Burkholderiales bacterium]
MRQIVLDTETTGLDPSLGHRVIELAAVEIVNRRITERNFHRYVNPEREIEAGAMQVHGISDDFLADKPKFRDVAKDFLEFVEGAELIIHNAAFDVAFLDAELGLLELGAIGDYCEPVTDTLKMAKELHPGKRNSLDALCERYAVDNSARTLHGALLDARLLAEVYLAMTRGQDSLLMELAESPKASAGAVAGNEKLELIVLRASNEELAQHAAQLEAIDKASKGNCLWKKLEPAD